MHIRFEPYLPFVGILQPVRNFDIMSSNMYFRFSSYSSYASLHIQYSSPNLAISFWLWGCYHLSSAPLNLHINNYSSARTMRIFSWKCLYQHISYSIRWNLLQDNLMFDLDFLLLVFSGSRLCSWVKAVAFLCAVFFLDIIRNHCDQ